jgi:hypothetical protein
MARVHLWAGLRRFTDGAEVIEIEGATIAQILATLRGAYPGLAPILDGGVSVVVDGALTTNRHAPVAATSEVFLLQRIKGG